MVAFIKNRQSPLLLTGIFLLTIFRILIPFSSGYYGVFNDVFLLCTDGVRYALIAIYATTTIITILNRNHKLLSSVLWIVLILAGLMPIGNFTTLGALLSLDNANPEQFRNDARTVLDEYGPRTLFSDLPQRVRNEYPQVPRRRIPPSILRANVGDMLVLKDYVFVEKFGLNGLFRGFVVFREGSDVWQHEKPFTLLEGCSYCWRIRVIDGLYWYHAVPIEEEVTTVAFPLK